MNGSKRKSGADTIFLGKSDVLGSICHIRHDPETQLTIHCALELLAQ
jgi:hypothetical protein